ncbi:patatin-like phospholipase family protein [Oceanimonas baumannii]|uniref:patatin-like phospholipase family protein n=1 Tax=Oceanimonas baumannii TaxID=129578 RepID=UPI003A92155E
MSESSLKIGLALAGGGAKGAYQVGVVKAISELGIPVDCVAGASIGALNGAMISASGNMSTAYERLLEVWSLLGSNSPVSFSSKLPINIALMAASGAAFKALPVLSSVIMGPLKLLEKAGVDEFFPQNEVLDSDFLVRLLEKYLSSQELRSGLPMFASVYESSGAAMDICKVLLATFGIKNTQNSEYFHIQSLSDSEMKLALLASSALPVLYSSRMIEEKRYSDGGQGDWQGETGNVPVKPLVDAKCNLIIVGHLSDGSLWERSAYSHVNFIEIRPRRSISRSRGPLAGPKDLLGFRHDTIPSWIEQGYEDAMYSLTRVLDVMSKYNKLQHSNRAVSVSLDDLGNADTALNKAFERIKLLNR